MTIYALLDSYRVEHSDWSDGLSFSERPSLAARLMALDGPEKLALAWVARNKGIVIAADDARKREATATVAGDTARKSALTAEVSLLTSRISVATSELATTDAAAR
jgi:hypothetical protein